MAHDAMIAAGGWGHRFYGPHEGFKPPKSLQFARNAPIIVSTVQNLLRAGCADIIILNNRPEWTDRFRQIFSDLNYVTILEDKGYESTFKLTLDFAHLMREKFVFIYGHAPRAADQISTVLKSNALFAASAYVRSSRRGIIPHRKGFIEPPFFCSSDDILLSDCDNWQAYCRKVKEDMDVIATPAPNEANTRDEYENYIEYYRKFDNFLA